MNSVTEEAQSAAPNYLRENTGVLALLGLCPLLGVTTTLINGLALGIATTAVLLLSNLLTSLARRVLTREVRLLFYVLVIATAVTVVDRLLATHFFRLHLALGIYLPLIASNCLIVARAEVYASKNSVGAAALDAIRTGACFTAAMIIVGALREAIGSGTFMADAQFLFGPGASDWTVHFGDGFLLAKLAPGAFICLAFVIAARNAIEKRFLTISSP